MWLLVGIGSSVDVEAELVGKSLNPESLQANTSALKLEFSEKFER
jgi:hypothetical protein